MSDALTILRGASTALANSETFKSLLDLNKTLAGNAGGVPRISIKGGRFREIVGGEQVRVFKGDALNVVVVNAAPVGRTYFDGAYDPSVAAPPSCWSSDCKVPSPDVPPANRMSANCATCPMNVKGSGAGESRACRFSQRLAVLLDGDAENTVYQMQLPATSIFGEAKSGNMGMQAYAKLLAAHNSPITALVTAISFDEDTETPKLYFRPVRALSEAELRNALASRDSEEALFAITMTVSQTDKVPRISDQAPPAAAEEAPKAKAKAKAKVRPEAEEDDAEEEPVKRAGRAPAGAPAKHLASIIGEWDDEDE